MKKMAMAAAAVGAFALPAGAGAHVFIQEPEVPTDGFGYLDFIVPHGCDGSSTTQVTVQIPENVPSVTPEVQPGWTLETKTGPKEEVELFGETVTEGISEVTWTAENGQELPDEQARRFWLEAKLPAGEPGESVYFPTIQTCEKGETRWIEVPAEGETEENLESPAPAVVLTEAEGEAHGDDSHSDDAATDEEADDAVETADDSDSDDDGDGMTIAALALGGLGFVFGGISLARSRKA